MRILRKSSKLALYVPIALVFAVLYGYMMYTLYQSFNLLERFTMLHAYLMNIIVIILLLILDKYLRQYWDTKCLSKKKINLFDRYLIFESMISVKTTLYLFYTFILITSRVSIMQPELISETFRGFVLSIEYCLILVVAFDKFIEHLAKDIKRIKKISKQLEISQAENTE